MTKCIKYSSNLQPIINNFLNGHHRRLCDEGNYSEVHLFCTIMQQNVIKKEINIEYAPLASIQPGMPIEFTVKAKMTSN